jgi:hypothetical protein
MPSTNMSRGHARAEREHRHHGELLRGVVTVTSSEGSASA